MYIGVDIGGTKIQVAASSNGLTLGKAIKNPTPQNSKAGLLLIKQMISEASQNEHLEAIGISVPGVMINKKVVTMGNLPDWVGLNIEKELRETFNLPCIAENDADLAALTEATIGAAKGNKNVVYVTFSTGVGTGIIIDGKIYSGGFGSEGGHMTIDPGGPDCGCGGKGHLEAIVSGPAINKRYGKQAYEITDSVIWNEISYYMAIGLLNFHNLLSPDIIVLGGGVSTHYDLFGKLLDEHLKNLSTVGIPPKVVLAKYVEEAPLYGAIIAAKNL